MYDAYDILAFPEPTAKKRKLLQHYLAILAIHWKLPPIDVFEGIWKLMLRALGSHEAEKLGLLWFFQVHTVLDGQLDGLIQLL